MCQQFIVGTFIITVFFSEKYENKIDELYNWW